MSHKIVFGKIVDVQDPEKINRVRVSIAGYTNEIATEYLPWYFPSYGQKYLPIINDIVSVIIHNDNITHGFYSEKIDLISNGLDGTEYENYVELYKRLNVVLTYKESEGWMIINKNSNIQINEEQIDIISKKINHNNGAEPMVLGIQLFNILTRLLNAILAETHTTPVGPSGPPINASTYSGIKSDLEKIKSKLSFLQ